MKRIVFYIIVFLVSFSLGFFVFAQNDVFYNIFINSNPLVNQWVVGNYSSPIGLVFIVGGDRGIAFSLVSSISAITGNYTVPLSLGFLLGSNGIGYNIVEQKKTPNATISPVMLDGFVIVGGSTYTFVSPTTTATSTTATATQTTTTTTSSAGGGYYPGYTTTTVAEPEVITPGTVTEVYGVTETTTNIVERLVTFIVRQFDVALLFAALMLALIVLVAVMRR